MTDPTPSGLPQPQSVAAALAGVLFSFGGFLTSHETRWKFSAYDEAGPMVKAIEEFAAKHGVPLDDVNVTGWTAALSAPAVETVAALRSIRALANGLEKDFHSVTATLLREACDDIEHSLSQPENLTCPNGTLNTSTPQQTADAQADTTMPASGLQEPVSQEASTGSEPSTPIPLGMMGGKPLFERPVAYFTGTAEGGHKQISKQEHDRLTAEPAVETAAVQEAMDDKRLERLWLSVTDKHIVPKAAAFALVREYERLRAPLPVAPKAAPDKWIFDPHDIEQGMMLNPEWLKLHGLTAKEAAQADSAQPVVADTREAFEAWVRTKPGGTDFALRRRDVAGSPRVGEYVHASVEFAWQAVQALASPPRAPVGADTLTDEQIDAVYLSMDDASLLELSDETVYRFARAIYALKSPRAIPAEQAEPHQFDCPALEGDGCDCDAEQAAPTEQATFAAVMRSLFGSEFPSHANDKGEYPGWSEYWEIFQAGAALAAHPHEAADRSAEADKLHAAIMNIRCGRPAPFGLTVEDAYKMGHRDARHVAAELVAAMGTPAAAEPGKGQP